MRVPVSWLREYVTVDASTIAIADRLAISTCEVERIIRQGVADENGASPHRKVAAPGRTLYSQRRALSTSPSVLIHASGSRSMTIEDACR